MKDPVFVIHGDRDALRDGEEPEPVLTEPVTAALLAEAIDEVRHLSQVEAAVRALAGAATAATSGESSTMIEATEEAPIHPNVKAQIVANDERGTQIVFREFGNTARVARNSVSQDIAHLGARPGAAFSDVAALASGKRGRQRVLREGDVEGGMWWAGQVQGLIDSVESCETVVRTIVADAEGIISGRLRRQLAPSADMTPVAAG
ncbi:nitronate monooxygenase [Streptomyces sp. NBC_00365]|uniref:nitronate monooxygenase n=1 Tax=Streptomyces sp. NBC_00365 TaxID=2975726 RepID=UPI002252C4E3|nr:nitronate monooxygenase [Streptomyces sp. NBC_00365]MCX5096633.1 nitronate monooxygenase [Streptomyces sp. NBC_00365]